MNLDPTFATGGYISAADSTPVPTTISRCAYEAAGLAAVVAVSAAPICEACARHVHPHDAVTVIRANGWHDTYCGDCAPIEEDE